MNIKKLSLYFFSLCLLAASATSTLAEDTEIYVGNGSTDSDGVRPNVLFMLDTSSSMTAKDGGSISRLDRMKEALRIIINQSNNVNMGLMRFHREGGPVLYPVKNINEPVEEEGGGADSDLIIQVADSADDAEEHVGSGVMVLTGTDLEMSKISVGSSSVDLIIPVSIQNDDAEESSSGNMYRNSSDLEFMNESVGSSLQKIGVRFQNIVIPQGATITSAKIEFYLDETKGRNGTLDIKVLGHKVTNSNSFSSSNNDISNRINNNPTSASVIWSPETGLSIGDPFETSNLKTIAQEIVNQGGWAPGNAMTFLFQLDSAGSGGVRTAESASHSSKKAKLKISYSVGGLSGEQKVGLRFQQVMIPKGATITSAVLEFEAATTGSASSDLTIKGEDIDDSPAFATTNNNISTRTTTSATVPWTAVPNWTADTRYQSPDITTIIQEQVNRAGWCGGQSLSVVLSGVVNSLRIAKSYDNSSTAAPTLRVSYDPDSVPAITCINQVVQASISSGTNDVEENGSGNVSTGSSDLELVTDGSDQTIGLRFTNINIPQGTNVVSAELIFSNDVSEPQSGAITLSIKGENVDDSAAFATTANNVSSRATTGNVAWSPSSWGSSSELHSSANIASIVQAIVNRAGWDAGNAMTFVITKSSGSGKRVANSFEGDASISTRLKIVVSGGADIPAQTVRDKLIETVDNLNYKGGTPILDVMYEAARYYRGEGVLYGRTRGYGAVIGDGSLGDGSNSRNEYTRVSNPLAWNGGGTIIRPAGCSEDAPNDTDCKGEYISGTANYISPITESCQANYQILLSDGSGYGTTSVSLVNSMMTDTPACSGHDGCAEALSGFLNNRDQMSGDDFENDQTVSTYTIGFNIAGTDPGFLQDIANAGGGSFHTADTAAELADVFQTILSEVLANTSSFSAPTVSVNAFNKLFHDDDVYFSTFLPSSTGRWAGNLKKYKICEAGNETCTAGRILDKNGVHATAANGQFIDTSTSFWSTSADGKEVQSGGAGSKITYPRKIFIEDGSNFIELTEAKATAGGGSFVSSLRTLLDAGSLSDGDYLNLAKWILGKDVRDEDDDNDTTDTRWAFADALHSQPLVITYGKEGSNPIKKIFIGTNDGLLHMINAETGIEEWAFMPAVMTALQNQLMVNANANHISGIDGNIRSWIIDNDDDGIIEPANGDKVYIFFGMRRGGRQIYALDVTPTSTIVSASATSPITPALLWKKQGGTDMGFDELGQTWSTPQFNHVWYYGVKKPAIFFGGGYHTGQDTTYGASAYGNGIYILDALTGALLWRAGKTGSLDVGENGAEFAEMLYPIPSDLALLDMNGDEAIDRIYVGDLGGQVWRMDLANTASGMLGTGARLADISGRDALGVVATANKRKFFYPPDVAKVSDFTFSPQSDFDLLLMVSGDRSAPNTKTVHDRIYMFRDYVITGTIAEEAALPEPDAGDPDTRRFVDNLTESDLYDATENLIQDANGGWTSDDALDEIDNLRDKDGWYVSLVEGTTTWVGEKGLSEPSILNGIALLTTYLPSGELDPDEVCSTPIEGTGRLYGLNILNAAAVYPEWDGTVDAYARADRIYNQSLTGIPSSPVIRMTPEGPQSLTGGGGGIITTDLNIKLPVVRSYWKEL